MAPPTTRSATHQRPAEHDANVTSDLP